MPCELLSRVYSTNTVVEGIEIVKKEVGMDALTSPDAALEQELLKLEEMELKRQRGIATPVRSMALQAGPDEDTVPASIEYRPLSGPGSPEISAETNLEMGDGAGEEGEPQKSLNEEDTMMAAWFGVYDDDFGGPTSPGSPVVPCASDPYVDAVDLGEQDVSNENTGIVQNTEEVKKVEKVAPAAGDTPKATGESNEMKRLRRVMQPRADGTYIVPQEIVDKWADTAGGGRNLVIQMWNASETNKEEFIKRCRRKVESIKESQLEVDGEFMSEQDMLDENYKPNKIAAIKADCAKVSGWIRRDRYEKHVKLYWVEKNLKGKSLKKRREVLEYEEEIDEEKFDGMMASSLDNPMPGGFELPEDTTDPTIVIEADGDEDTKKSLKMLAFPVMDDDAVPSSYIQKVQGAIGKWRVKMHAMVAVKDELEEVPESMGQLFDKALEFDEKLKEVEEKIMTINMQGIVDGFTKGHQDDLVEHFKTSRQWQQVALFRNHVGAALCVFKIGVCKCFELVDPGAVFASNNVPFVNHIKGLVRKRQREADSKAPAKSLAEHHQALAQELKSCPELAGHLSTRGIGGDTKNSSRQYKRLVQRGCLEGNYLSSSSVDFKSSLWCLQAWDLVEELLQRETHEDDYPEARNKIPCNSHPMSDVIPFLVFMHELELIRRMMHTYTGTFLLMFLVIFSAGFSYIMYYRMVMMKSQRRVKWLEPGFLSIFVLDCVPCQRREYGSWPGLACIYRHRHRPWEEIASVFRTLILKYRSHFWKAMGAGIKYDGFPMVSLMVSPMVSMFAGENRP
ncbi:unnamed protein product [Cladocopium goreaui]|uniref:Uncharacterized protein n=1 Tax=Cladocopium goreaui TaxID=2562237 RepID=A0A9P1FHN7_9DINO|nr:unnamed protein product [Cladocopium goreaui]